MALLVPSLALPVLSVLLLTATPARAQDTGSTPTTATTPPMTLKDQLQAQKDVLSLQKDITGLQNDIHTNQNKQVTDAIKSLSDITKPTGASTVSADGVDSPASTLLAAQALRLAAGAVAAEIKDPAGAVVIMVPPGSELLTRSRRPVFEVTRTGIAYDSGLLLKELDKRKPTPVFQGTSLPQVVDDISGAPLVQMTGLEVAVAVPALLSAVSGFFNVDTTEKVISYTLTDADASAAVVAALKGQNSTLTAWVSREAYLFDALNGNLMGTETVKAMNELAGQTGKLSYALSFIAQEQAKATVLLKTDTDALAANKSAVDDLVADQKKDKPLPPGTTADAQAQETQRRTTRDDNLRDLRAAGDKLQADLLLQNDRIQVLTSLNTRLTAQVNRAATFLSGLLTKDGDYPLVIWLLMEEKIPKTAVQLSVHAVAQKGSSITRKYFLGSSYYVNAAVVLRYTLSSADGKILKAGTVQKGLAYKQPRAGDLPDIAWNNADNK